MKYVLDTHAWFWALTEPGRIPASVRKALENPRNAPHGLSAISVWELAKLVQKGRIRLTIPLSDWMARALDPDWIELIPLSPQICVDSTALPGGFHADPADELIVATARSAGAALVTADKHLRSYPSVKSEWS
ncbi:MAG: type II toxin-antitoxin system VapC family toxin [Verrucomicrobiota bacterium]